MKNEKHIPAIRTPLHGHALIEASAGTGKTWTLSGILLRLLIEEGREPRHIVATTFTRAAASEMRHRVHERLQTFQKRFNDIADLLPLYQANPALFEHNTELRERINNWQTAQDTPDNDPIDRHLIHHAWQNGIQGLLDAYNRSHSALAELNQMFIGTLDSLCQRWLHELALESGTDTIRINTAPDAIAQLSHDHLRRYYHQQAQTNAERFAAFYAQKAPDYLKNSQIALNHGDATFLPLPPLPDTLPDPRDALRNIPPQAASELQALTEAYRAAGHLSGTTKFGKNQQHLFDLFIALQQNDPLTSPQNSLLEGIADLYDSEGGSPFNKSATADIRQSLADHPVLKALHQAQHMRSERSQQLHLMRLHSLQANSEHVRERLSAALNVSGETTYGELLTRLNTTLSEKPELCQYLAHRYPILLVDEAQDLNHEQSELLRRIYNTPDAPDRFWLLVGDPKQAIYRFRGSDVAHYTQLKTQIPQQDTLPSNHRSSPALIDTLNRYYANDPANRTLGEGITYHPVTAENPERHIVQRNGQAITTPIHWIDAANKDEEIANITRLITHLTSDNSPWLRQSDSGLSPLEAKDILILARGNDYLQTLETALQHAGIQSERQADQSLFAQDIAQEMAWLFSALISPNHSAIIRRLLIGKLYGLDLATLDQLSDSPKLDQFQQKLAQAGQRWTQHGLLAALQTLWHDDPWNGNIWTRLAAQPHPAKWRDLLDLRRLQDIIASHEQAPHRFLDWWRRQLADPPTAEWALCLPLPGSNAVRLMTIHKAKGLQSPVVILAGMGQSNNHDDIQPLHYQGARHLATGHTDPAIAQQLEHENNAEARRLLYVALTRAEDLLFIHLRKSRAFPPLKTLSDHNHITAQPLDHLLTPPDDPTPIQWAPRPQAAPPRQNAPLPKTTLNGWRKTSFTALASHIPADRRDLAIYDTLDLELQNEPAPSAPAAFPFAFPRGPQAGSFLHETLEKIRWQRRAHWHIFFQALIDKHHLPELHNHLPDLQHWFSDILQSPLTSGIALHQLTQAEREMGFTLALNASRPLPYRAISDHFAAWGKPLPLTPHKSLYRYLRGEIDLLYHHNGRYHILDYKSNHLGDHPHDYHESAMTRAMNDHHYWLQAALYQIALHRLLQNRLPDYRPADHLGAVEYYFIRAANPDSADGHLAIDIPTDWLLHLNELLSTNSEK